ncbi:MAG: protease propeptide/inhibitor [Benniella sp.]|nr:MAG: protease propeptide/inhibitor [Benniella sp.]
MIIVFKDDTPQSEIDEAVRQVESSGGKVTNRYESALLGFSAEFPEASVSVLDALTRNPHLDYIGPDGTVTTQDY